MIWDLRNVSKHRSVCRSRVTNNFHKHPCRCMSVLKFQKPTTGKVWISVLRSCRTWVQGNESMGRDDIWNPRRFTSLIYKIKPWFPTLIVTTNVQADTLMLVYKPEMSGNSRTGNASNVSETLDGCPSKLRPLIWSNNNSEDFASTSFACSYRTPGKIAN